MPVVRCPQCGASTPYGARPLARCPSCREPLGKCRYCRHYSARTLDCLHPSHIDDDRVVDADQAINCPFFSSTLTTRPASRARPIFRIAALSIVACLVIAFLLVRFVGPRATGPPTSLDVTVMSPESVLQEDGIDISVAVLNSSENPAQGVRVAISGSSLRHLACRSIEPAECRAERTPRYVAANLGNLAPGESGMVVFHFSCNRPGQQSIAAQVTADNLPAAVAHPILCEIIP